MGKAPAMKAKAMTKGALADALATATEVKKSQCAKLLDTLATVATAQVKAAGVFTVPGLCRIKTRVKPATKAGKREIFGKTNCEGKAGQDSCEGFPRRCFKEQYLIAVGALLFYASLSSFTVEFPRSECRSD